ncbi:CopG family transcriptional regulator [Verrucomicrobium sp. 3C]|uniref:ribbon-helix-helix domain-containing protein n=1 Tax=Verrucomicrobium sp. 3C TaxID=1134055 RepID=UPI0003723E5E|nr:CopG family transcriptional regulator [Verrucomicrobium sp. 3C]
MAIVRPKPKNAEAFISGAPDAEPKPKGVRKGKKQQISLTIAPALLRKVDELAAEIGQSRAAVINLAIHRAVEHGLEIEGLRK